jgi:hypothetical protein
VDPGECECRTACCVHACVNVYAYVCVCVYVCVWPWWARIALYTPFPTCRVSTHMSLGPPPFIQVCDMRSAAERTVLEALAAELTRKAQGGQLPGRDARLAGMGASTLHRRISKLEADFKVRACT